MRNGDWGFIWLRLLASFIVSCCSELSKAYQFKLNCILCMDQNLVIPFLLMIIKTK